MITQQNPTLCRMCGSKGETVAHEVSECGKLAQTEYKGRHDKKEKRDLGPVVTCCNPLPRTIN